jgi:hypothetical protein
LHCNCTRSDLTDADDVTDPLPNKFAATQLAVDRKVKQHSIKHSAAFVEKKADLPSQRYTAERFGRYGGTFKTRSKYRSDKLAVQRRSPRNKFRSAMRLPIAKRHVELVMLL